MAILQRRFVLPGIALVASVIVLVVFVGQRSHDTVPAAAPGSATACEPRLDPRSQPDPACEAVEREKQAVSAQKALVDTELTKSRDELVKERDAAQASALAAEHARRVAEDSERKARKAESDALAAQAENARLNRELQQLLAKERQRKAELDKALGSQPIEALTK